MLFQLTIGSSCSSDSSEISISSSTVRRVDFFLLPLPLEGALMASKNWLLVRFE
jgi:hypothetical protein